MRRLAVLFARLSGYMSTCLRTLAERYDVKILVVRIPPTDRAPFNERHFNWIDELYDRPDLEKSEIIRLLTNFNADAVLMSGWFDSTYLQVARVMRKRGIPVVAGSDSQWKGTMRQHVAQIMAPWYLHPAIDVLWGAGERQRQFARRLGFQGDQYWNGIYACDWETFARADVTHDRGGQPPFFLYVGRYVDAKGIDTLTAAYRHYRNQVDEPWELHCAGSGPLADHLQSTPGIVDNGFVQPPALPRLMQDASGFVLSSRHEPWGVVVQEAAVSRLPLICSEACGAAVHFLQDGYNGFSFDTSNADHLAQCMVRLSELDPKKRKKMGERSYMLSKQFTPRRWADTLFEGVGHLCDGYQS